MTAITYYNGRPIHAAAEVAASCNLSDSEREAVAAAFDFTDADYAGLPSFAPMSAEPYRNDVCPVWRYRGVDRMAELWVDFADAEAREFVASPRFNVVVRDYDGVNEDGTISAEYASETLADLFPNVASCDIGRHVADMCAHPYIRECVDALNAEAARLNLAPLSYEQVDALHVHGEGRDMLDDLEARCGFDISDALAPFIVYHAASDALADMSAAERDADPATERLYVAALNDPRRVRTARKACPRETPRLDAPADLAPCRFYFDGSDTFDGFTDGSTWNGWDNVWCTVETHRAILAQLYGGTFCELLAAIKRGEDTGYADFAEMKPDARGLISYAYGYCTALDNGDAEAQP